MKTQNQTKNNDQLKKPAVRFSKWILLAIAIVGVTGVALAATVLRGHGGFTGQATLTPLDAGIVNMEINATGIITHLGKCKVRLHTVADFSGPLPTPIPPSTGVITAANGDTISFNLRWTLKEVAPGVFETVGPFTITGGTGRFKNATGGGDYGGLVDTITGDVVAKIAGELRL